MPDASTLNDLAPIVAVVVILSAAIVWIVKINYDSHKEKTIAFTQSMKDKDQLFANSLDKKDDLLMQFMREERTERQKDADQMSAAFKELADAIRVLGNKLSDDFHSHWNKGK